MNETIKKYGEGRFSYSFLKNFALSPKHAKAYMLREFKETPALLFGRLFHAVMANQLKDEFLIYDDMQRPDLNKTMAAAVNKSWKRQIIEDAMDANLTIASIDDLELAEQMRDSVNHHPLAHKLLKWDGDVEKSYDNEKYKGRADKVVHNRKLIIDWKSTVKLNPDYIEYDIRKYHLDAQAALYNNLIGKGKYSVMLVFIEKQEPFDLLPVMIEPDSETMQTGADKIRQWTGQAIEAFKNDTWPGCSLNYPDGVMYAE